PELAVLLSYSKIVLYQQLLDSDVPEDPFLSHELVRYFPEPLHEKYAGHMQRHRLKREIIATAVTNSIVNRMGATFILRTQEDTGQTAAAVVKAYNAARQILHARELWSGIDALDGKVSQSAQIDALMKLWSLLRHVSRWLLNRPGTVGITDLVQRYQPGMDKLRAALPATLTETGRATCSTGRPDSCEVSMTSIATSNAGIVASFFASSSGKSIPCHFSRSTCHDARPVSVSVAGSAARSLSMPGW